MREHQTDDTEDLDAAIESLQDQLDFLVKILRALDDQAPRRSANRAEFEDALLQQIADLTQRVVCLTEQRKSSSGSESGSGVGSRTTIPPPGGPSAEQDALLLMMRNVPFEETERDRLLAEQKAEALRRKAFQERQAQLRAAREGRLAARTKHFLRRWLRIGFR